MSQYERIPSAITRTESFKMLSNFFKKLSTKTQAHLGMWLTNAFTDSYDVARYDSHIHSLLSQFNIKYQTYAPMPWFDYCNPSVSTWKIFIFNQQEWQLLQLPNPLHASRKPHSVSWRHMDAIAHTSDNSSNALHTPLHA